MNCPAPCSWVSSFQNSETQRSVFEFTQPVFACRGSWRGRGHWGRNWPPLSPGPQSLPVWGRFTRRCLCAVGKGTDSPRELFPIATSLLTCCWSSVLLCRHCNYSLFFIYVLSYSHTQLPMGNKHSSCKHLIRFIVLIMSFLFMCSCVVDWKLSLMLVVWLSGYWFHFYVFYKRNCLSVCSHWYLDFVFHRLRWYDREGPENHSAWYRDYSVEGLSLWTENLKYGIFKMSFIIRSSYTKQQRLSKTLTRGTPWGNLF